MEARQANAEGSSGAETGLLVSVIILTYRQAQIIEETIQSVLAQDYSPLEIVISDDCSPDDTFEVVQSIIASYDGPHSVVLTRTNGNQGITGNLQHAVAASQGQFLVLHGGDDLSLPHRSTALAKTWIDHGRSAKLIYCDAVTFGDNVVSPEVISIRYPKDLTKAVRGHVTLGATIGIDRVLFDGFPAIDPDCVGEDFILPIRAGLLGEVVHLREVLVRYRVSTSEWKSRWNNGDGDGQLEPRSEVIQGTRYKCGVLRIHLYRQSLADLDASGVPRDRLRRVLRSGIAENVLFVSFIDRGLRTLLAECSSLIRHPVSGLRAYLRYRRLMRRDVA